MLITDLQEFRLYFPTHAYDTLDPFVGVLDNSEHDFLQEKLGTPLYNALCDWYDQHPADRSSVDARYAAVSAASPADISPYNRLLLLAQRCIAYDAMQRAISMNIISINNAGVNISTADDYGKVDLAAVDAFKSACIKESHAAVNRLLQTLEEWCQQAAALASASSVSGDTIATPDIATPDDEATVPDGSPSGSAATALAGSSQDESSQGPSAASELQDICQKWRSSRYFYLSTSLLIPTATCLQTYINIYDSREKFIQLLPDLLYIQEEFIANAIGEDFLAYLVRCSVNGDTIAVPDKATVPDGSPSGLTTPITATIIHRLRKVMAALLVERTTVLKFSKEQKVQAHTDGVRMLSVACTYIQNHQPAILAALDATVLSSFTAADSGSALAGLPSEEEKAALIEAARAPFTTSPLYVKEEESPTASERATVPCAPQGGRTASFENNRPGSALFLTPFLN